MKLNPSCIDARRRRIELVSIVPSEKLTDMIDCPLLHISDPAPTFKSSNGVSLRPLEIDDEDDQNIDVVSDTIDSSSFESLFADDTDSLFGDTNYENDEHI